MRATKPWKSICNLDLESQKHCKQDEQHKFIDDWYEAKRCYWTVNFQGR